MFLQRFSQKSGKKKTDAGGGGGGGGGELDVGKSPLSELGGDRLKEMEKIHSMESEEVRHKRERERVLLLYFVTFSRV